MCLVVVLVVGRRWSGRNGDDEVCLAGCRVGGRLSRQPQTRKKFREFLMVLVRLGSGSGYRVPIVGKLCTLPTTRIRR